MTVRDEIPLVLRGNLFAVPVSTPAPGTYYSEARQLWVRADGAPVVEAPVGRASDFGETTRTDSHEGVDQSEVSQSDFGETTLTKTSEGVDQTEWIGHSDFGETTKTATGEGADQSEGIATSVIALE